MAIMTSVPRDGGGLTAPRQQVMTSHLSGGWRIPPLGLKGFTRMWACGENHLCQLGCLYGCYYKRDLSSPDNNSVNGGKFNNVFCPCFSFQYFPETDTILGNDGTTWTRR